MNHGFGDLIVQNLSFPVDFHDTAQSQSVLSCIQGTDPIGKGMGQHGNHPVHQINTGSPFDSLSVKSRIFLYIIGHIRNVHPQAVKVPFHRKAYRIIQILGILAVNGHHIQIPQIQPARHICLRYGMVGPSGLIQHTFREFHRQIVGFDNRQNIHTRIFCMAQYFCDNAFGIFPRRAVIRYFHHYFLSVYRAFGTLPRHKDIRYNPDIIRQNKPEGTMILKSPYNLAHIPLQNLYHFRFLPFPASARQYPGLHRISRKRAAHSGFRNKQILRTAFHFQKAKTFLIANKSTAHICFFRLFIPPSLGELQFPFCQQFFQNLFQSFPILSAHLQKDCQFLFFHRYIEFIVHQLTD